MYVVDVELLVLVVVVELLLKVCVRIFIMMLLPVLFDTVLYDIRENCSNSSPWYCMIRYHSATARLDPWGVGQQVLIL